MAFSKTDQTKSVKKKRRRTLTRRQKVERELDTLSARKCREQGYCTTCGKDNGVLNAHHYKSRVYKGVRWYQPNLICLCVHCHTFSHKFSAHKTPEAFKKRLIEERGQEWHDDIEKRAIEHTSWKIAELEALLAEYKSLE